MSHIAIVGGGIAGLSCALYLVEKNPSIKISIFLKETLNESNTMYAQGGIAGVIDKGRDSVSSHVQDTLEAGHFQNNKHIVEKISHSSEKAIHKLIEWGVNFDKDNKGNYATALEGGHSYNRILHFKDKTGSEIQKKLLKQCDNFSNIVFKKKCRVLDFNLENNSIKDIVYWDILDKKVKAINCTSLVLATGGIGQLYLHTTNPIIATGDGLAMSIRNGIKIKDFPYVQFHPTALYNVDLDKKKRLRLISEAVRGEGARLKNNKGEYFMEKYHPKKDLAPRDIVSRAIFLEMQNENKPYMYLDISHLREDFAMKFPTITVYFDEQNIDWKKNDIPIVPAAHYHCGGVEIDENGKSSAKGVYAIGELACSGFHGTNRLASNSLLEAVVFAQFVSDDIVRSIDFNSEENIPESVYHNWIFKNENSDQIKKCIHDIKQLMQTYMGVYKSHKNLNVAKSLLEHISKKYSNVLEKKEIKNVYYYEVKNMFLIAQQMVQESIDIKKNSGVFYNIDLENK